VDISYAFRASDGHTFTIEERNYLDAATIQANCSSPGRSVQIVTGLPMLHSTSNVGMFRSYYFATARNKDFIISASIATDDTATPARFASVYNTFRPIYTTPACR
jgi:hypothetical protein